MANKILVVAAAGIGDCLIATPLIHELRANFPDAEIHAFVVWKGSKDFLEGNPHLNTVHQKNLVTDSVVDSLRYLFGLRRHRYDISINAHPQGRVHYRILSRIVGARLRVSHAYENSGWWDRCLIHRSIPQDYTVHTVENNNRLLPLVGAKPMLAKHEFELFLGRPETAWAEEYASRHDLPSGPCLGVHVGSGGTKNLKLKRWPFPHWFELIQRLANKRPDARILLFGGPEEKTEHEEILKATKGSRVLAPITENFRQAAALLKYCNAFLSVDTVLMHLAAAMKVPNQLVIEAPTLNPTNLPWQNAYQLIPNPAIAGRHLEYYRYDGGPIRGSDEELKKLMASVTVDAVETAVLKVLGE
ncbi:MAG TPA: glycosyltransferase family 9 protein [Verrucomicrobiae bacterium]|nr:glycosyltransferase family 9 protein [Verrucomicrobiae bacterium]